MEDDLIRDALESATHTVTVEIGDGVVDRSGPVFADCFEGRTAVVVADSVTWEVAGEQVRRSLDDAGCPTVEPFVFLGDPVLYASYDNVEMLVGSLRGHDAVPVAVGSGTLNDLVKRSAEETDRPYMVVGTAASMDGYTSFGASITAGGHKQTFECAAPVAAVLDLAIALAAPRRLTASGYGDLIGKVPAGADWIVADELGIDPIDDAVWSRVQGPLSGAIGNPAGLAAGDHDAMQSLVGGLVMSGLAMQAHESSRPASGAEHQFSHLWEMEGHGVDQEPPLSHGFKVALGTIAIAALYERLLRRDLSSIDVDALVATWPSRDDTRDAVLADHDTLEDLALEQTLAKYVTGEQLRERLERLARRWPTIRTRVTEQLRPADQLREMIAAAGAPTHPHHIGLSLDTFQETYRRSRTIRSRYTVLDLAFETALLDELVDELFAPGGFWAEHPDT